VEKAAETAIYELTIVGQKEISLAHLAVGFYGVLLKNI